MYGVGFAKSRRWLIRLILRRQLWDMNGPGVNRGSETPLLRLSRLVAVFFLQTAKNVHSGRITALGRRGDQANGFG